MAPLGKVVKLIAMPPPPPPLGVNVAVTDSSALIVTVQVTPVGTQLVLNPANVKLAPAAAVSTTGVSPAKVAVQVPGQVMPAGALVMVPVPVAVTVKDAAPVPERLTVCVLPAVGPLSEMVTAPVYEINCVGANPISRMH